MHMRGFQRAVVLWVSSAMLACGPDAPPGAPPQVPSPASSTSSATPSASSSAAPAAHTVVQAPNVEALKAALAADGFKVQVSASKAGQVSVINFVGPSPTMRLPHDVFVAVMKAHGDLLGYGVVGAPLLQGPSLPPGPVTSMIGGFPGATGCPQLHYEAAFRALDATSRTPLMWAFGCPGSPDSMAFFDQVHGTIQRISEASRAQAASVVDPLETWLRSEGMTVDRVTRESGRVVASLSSAPPLSGDRVAAVRSFAEKVASFEKLPVLDTVDRTPYADDEKKPAMLKVRFRVLKLRLAKPPLDGRCIDPTVTVHLADTAADPPSTPASARITDVMVACATEPAEGSKPPPDAGRTLPRAASSSLPFLLMCESTSFGWGYHHSGRVVDKRGDVYTFEGGEPFSGKSASELSVLIRHGKHYEGALPPADVDRLVALIAPVEREPLKTTPVQAFDMPGGGCSLFRAGGGPDALVPIRMSEFGTTAGKRVGPASSEAEKLLTKAEAVSRAP